MKKNLFRKTLLIILAIAMLLTLAACSVKDKPSESGDNTAPSGEDSETDENGRTAADIYSYDISGEEVIVENLVFNEDVTVTGENGRLSFINCEFNGDIINKGGEGARIALLQDCEIADGSECILDSSLEEATMDTDLPKFMIFCAMPNVSCENMGAVVSFAEQAIKLNGEEFPIDEAEFFMDDSTGEFDSYSGQEANMHNVAKWVEGGENVLMHMAILAAE